MIFKLISLYLFIAVLLLSFLFVYSFVRGRSSYAKVMGILSLSLQIYLLGYLLELNVTTLSEMYFWNQIQYFGIPFFPALWLVISLLYTGRSYLVKGYRGLLIFTVPLLTFFIRLTNDFHHLYYITTELQSIGAYNAMFLTKGPWYLVQMIYVLFALILCTWFYFQRYRKSTGSERIQFSLLLYASILPYLSLILVFINWGGIGIDYTAIILPPCIFLINLALTRYNFLDIKNLARERVFEDSTLGFILLNRVRDVVDYNKQSESLFKMFKILLKESNIVDILSHETDILNCVENSKECVFNRLIDNQDRYIHLHVSEIKNKDERVGQIITLEDVSEREKLKNRLIEMANTDVLSGLYNRRKFRECAEDAFNRAMRYNQSLSVLMMDIDLFKHINDNFGHTAGDHVIQSFAQLLKENFRSTDIIGRMGGEEFAVVLINCDEASSYIKAEHFRAQLENHKIIVDKQEIQIKVSIGLAIHDNKALNLDEIINHADHALYDAKNDGRNRTNIYRCINTQ